MTTGDEFLDQRDDALERQRLRAENARLRAALVEIAAFGDRGANERLAKTGSYGAFDEPGAVARAREALAGRKPQPEIGDRTPGPPLAY